MARPRRLFSLLGGAEAHLVGHNVCGVNLLSLLLVVGIFDFPFHRGDLAFDEMSLAPTAHSLRQVRQKFLEFGDEVQELEALETIILPGRFQEQDYPPDCLVGQSRRRKPRRSRRQNRRSPKNKGLCSMGTRGNPAPPTTTRVSSSTRGHLETNRRKDDPPGAFEGGRGE